MFTYYPDQRHALELTTIRRERLLPEEAIGTVEIEAGKRVNLRDVVARGTVPSRHVIVEAEVGVAPPISSHASQRRLAALAGPVDQHNGGIGQRLDEARLGEARMELRPGHVG